MLPPSFVPLGIDTLAKPTNDEFSEPLMARFVTTPGTSMSESICMLALVPENWSATPPLSTNPPIETLPEMLAARP